MSNTNQTINKTFIQAVIDFTRTGNPESYQIALKHIEKIYENCELEEGEAANILNKKLLLF